MKITCQACAAKYTIADDKVLGKVVKIRCKKCGATIVVNGNDPAAAGGGGAGAQAAPAYDYASQGAGGEQWTVNVADGDQRTMSDQEVADAYHAGVITDETFCWKDGMTDWLPLREIEPLYAACTSTRAMPPPSAMPAARHSDMPTRIQDTGGLVLGGGAPAPAPYVPPMAAAAPPPDAGNGGGMYTDASPVAARRAGGRAATADLFSGAAQAGSEEDVMTSAPAGIPQPHHDDQQKLTGARNENSVLFSLNALTSKGPVGGGAPMQATSEASGLIDIKQLGAQLGLGNQEKKRSAVDDIMNLAGGGAFSPSLSAPVLSAPPIEEYAPQPEAAAALPGPAPRNKLVIFGAIGAGVVVIALAVGAAALLMRGKDETADKDKAAASASAAVASASAASTDTPTPSASVAAATDTATQSAQPAPPPAPTSDNGNTGSTGSKSPTSAPAATPKPAATVAAAAPTQPAVPAAPAAPPAAAAPAADQPFNMGAAKSSLGAIAGAVQGCKRGDVSGTGRVVVTFAPSGAVQSAVVTDPPFAGTPTGSCVASRFRSAHVPPFSGSPFEVAKHFTIN